MPFATGAVQLVLEPLTPTDSAGMSGVPYAIQVASPGPYADCDSNGVRVAAWGAGLCSCCQHVVPNCCMATLCPCVSLAQIAARLGVFRFKSVLCGLFAVTVMQMLAATVAFAQVNGTDDPTSTRSTWRDRVNPRALLERSPRVRDLAYAADDTSFVDGIGAMVVNLFGVFCLALGAVYVLLAWHLRMKIRQRFEIPGSRVQDLLVSLLLPCCNVAQMATHVKSYKPRQCDFSAPDVLPAYPPLY